MPKSSFRLVKRRSSLSGGRGWAPDPKSLVISPCECCAAAVVASLVVIGNWDWATGRVSAAEDRSARWMGGRGAVGPPAICPFSIMATNSATATKAKPDASAIIGPSRLSSALNMPIVLSPLDDPIGTSSMPERDLSILPRKAAGAPILLRQAPAGSAPDVEHPPLCRSF